MPLTDAQVESLLNFTQKKFVHYYDLQLELVDHLASSIEEEMVADVTLSFEQALQKVYSRFGIFGFAKVVAEKTVAVRKNNWRVWRNAVKEFFTIPKITFTATMFCAALLIGKYLSSDFKAIIIMATWLSFMIWEIHTLYISRKMKVKKLLLTEPTSFSSGFGFIWPQFFINTQWETYHNNYFFAILFIFIVVTESAIIKVNKTVRNKALELYPEAFTIAS